MEPLHNSGNSVNVSYESCVTNKCTVLLKPQGDTKLLNTQDKI